MPCARCASDTTTYPKNTEWGPVLWAILHTLAERAGKQSNAMIQADEMRSWVLFVKYLPEILPCEECRDHASTYLKTVPFQPPPTYEATSLYIRSYFYTFHESVNGRLFKPAFQFSDLSETYKSTSDLLRWKVQLNDMMFRAMKLNGMQLQKWSSWLQQFGLLRAAMGI